MSIVKFSQRRLLNFLQLWLQLVEMAELKENKAEITRDILHKIYCDRKGAVYYKYRLNSQSKALVGNNIPGKLKMMLLCKSNISHLRQDPFELFP